MKHGYFLLSVLAILLAGCGGGAPKPPANKYESWLLKATEFDDLDGVKELVRRKDVNVDVQDRKGGYTPLYNAAYLIDADMVKVLLEHGADPNKKTFDSACGRTPFLGAIRSEKSAGDDAELQKIVDAMIEHGADINATDCRGRNALYFAIRRDHIGLAVKLVDLGIDVNYDAGHRGAPAVNYTVFLLGKAKTKARREKFEALLDRLLAHGADVNRLFKNATPLILAARYGLNDVSGRLLEAGADPDRRNNAGETALISAVKAKHYGLALQLYDAGADISVKDGDGRDVFAHTNNPKLIALLKTPRNPDRKVSFETGIDDLKYLKAVWEKDPAVEPYLFAIQNRDLDAVKRLHGRFGKYDRPALQDLNYYVKHHSRVSGETLDFMVGFYRLAAKGNPKKVFVPSYIIHRIVETKRYDLVEKMLRDALPIGDEVIDAVATEDDLARYVKMGVTISFGNFDYYCRALNYKEMTEREQKMLYAKIDRFAPVFLEHPITGTAYPGRIVTGMYAKGAYTSAQEKMKFEVLRLLTRHGIDLYYRRAENIGSNLDRIRRYIRNNGALETAGVKREYEAWYRTYSAMTPLIYAVKTGNRELVDFYLKIAAFSFGDYCDYRSKRCRFRYPIDINGVDSAGRNALDYALAYGRDDIADLLIKSGIEIRPSNLNEAIRHDNRKALAFMLGLGVKPNAQTLKILIDKGDRDTFDLFAKTYPAILDESVLAYAVEEDKAAFAERIAAAKPSLVTSAVVDGTVRRKNFRLFETLLRRAELSCPNIDTIVEAGDEKFVDRVAKKDRKRLEECVRRLETGIRQDIAVSRFDRAQSNLQKFGKYASVFHLAAASPRIDELRKTYDSEYGKYLAYQEELRIQRERERAERIRRNRQKCGEMYSYCTSACRGKSSSDGGLFSTREKCRMDCSNAKNSCENGDMIAAIVHACSGMCRGLDTRTSVPVFGSSDYDDCVSRCEFRFEDAGYR